MIGFAGAIVEDDDFGFQVVSDDEVVEAVASQIGGVQEANAFVHGEDFRAGETDHVGGGLAVKEKPKSKNGDCEGGDKFFTIHKLRYNARRETPWRYYSMGIGQRSHEK